MDINQKVLVIAYYFPPMGLSGVQRTLKFVKYLPEYSFSPIVLTTGTTNYFAFDETLFDDINTNTPVFRTEKDPFNIGNKKNNKTLKYPSRIKQKLFRMLSQTFMLPDSRKKWMKYAIELGDKIIQETPDIDVIFATAPPFTDFLVADELSKKYNIPFVVDYRDLWRDNPQYFFPTIWHKRMHEGMEERVLRHASKIVVISRNMQEKLLSRYRFLTYNDVRVIPHGFDVTDFIQADPNYKIGEYTPTLPKNNKKFVITHCGLFPDDRTPKYFLKAIKEFLDSNPDARNNINLRFVGILQNKHINMLKKYNLATISDTIGYVSHIDAIRYMLTSDVLWMMLNNNIETPGRFYEYIGTQKPMLISCPDGSIKNIANKSGAAWTTMPKDTAAIKSAIIEMYEYWQNGKKIRQNPNFVKEYDRKILTQNLARELRFSIKV